MATLLLRLAGPMQSWGTQSRFTIRDTGLEPSKSGVIGLLCAALGKPRKELPEHTRSPRLEELAALRMGVRVDREGRLRRDYHTAGGVHRRGERYGVARADGSRGDPVTSQRFFLADYDFLVGLEGENLGLLRQLDQALARPVWPLFLGRKSFVPSLPVSLPDSPPLGPGIWDSPLEATLRSHPWVSLGGPGQRRRPERFRLVVEDPSGQIGEVRQDVPVSFALDNRQFALRSVTTTFIDGAQVPIVEV